MDETEARFIALLRVQEIYNREFSKAELVEWVNAFKDTDPAVLNEAVSRMALEEDFPSIARLNRYYRDLQPQLPSGYVSEPFVRDGRVFLPGSGWL